VRRLGLALVAVSFALAGFAFTIPAGADGYQRFIVVCPFSHAAQNDPIVAPNQAGGAAHMHGFFGAAITNEDPSYARMNQNTATTCELSGDTAAYWVPALRHKTTGALVHATELRAYYYSTAAMDDDPVVPFPRGFSFITPEFRWGCGNVQSLPSPPDCTGTGKPLILTMTFEEVCWNGQIPGRDANFGPQWATKVTHLVNGECPASFPTQIPWLSEQIEFPVVNGTLYEIASAPAQAEHADFWNTWKQGVLIDLVEECLQPESIDCKEVSD
jgi:hypothetical protein